MADKAHEETDKKLEQMERRLSAIYSEAQKNVGEDWKAYLKEAGENLSDLQKEYEKAKMSGDQGKIKKFGIALQKAKKDQTLMDKRFRDLSKKMAYDLSTVNEKAAAYINGKLPEVYAENYNQFEKESSEIAGYSFTLTDANTVKYLSEEDHNLLPYKQLDEKKDVLWNTQKINSGILQGILTGESIPHIADRLQKSMVEMNRASAVRTARTAVTSAENKGRLDSYVQAEKDGIKLQREWMSTNDGRTRHAHRLLDKQIADVNKPFQSELGEIMYPGDPTAAAANVYNCRCTQISKILGFVKKAVENPKEMVARKWKSKKEYEQAKIDSEFAYKEKIELLESREKLEKKSLLDSYGGNFMQQRIAVRTNTNLSDEEKQKELEKIATKKEKYGSELSKLSEKFEKERDAALERKKSIYDLNYEFKKIKGEHSIREDSENVNPKFTTFKFEYTNNCQRCGVAYELRQRGYNVEALPAYNGGIGAGYDIRQIFSTAELTEFNLYGHEATIEVIKKVDSWGSGARGILEIHRADGTGHVYNVQNNNGVVTFVDSQCGSVWDASKKGFDTDGGAIENAISSALIRSDNALIHQIPDDYVRSKSK